MNRLILAATALGSLALAAAPAAAQRHWRGGHGGRSSFSLTIGGGYYGPYAGPYYGYDPYAYGYDPYYSSSYYAYPAYGYGAGYDRYYDRGYYVDRRHYRRHRRDRDRRDYYRR